MSQTAVFKVMNYTGMEESLQLPGKGYLLLDWLDTKQQVSDGQVCCAHFDHFKEF